MIKMVPYDSNWATCFSELWQVFNTHLSTDIIAIEHVGSTAVPQLYAKPILDIDIIIEEFTQVKKISAILEKLGYVNRGDLGIEDRIAFSQKDENAPYTDKQNHWMKHNLYVCIKDSISLQNHLLLRNYLLQDKAAVETYSQLKVKLASIYADDIDSYVKYKTPFICAILEKQGVAIEAIKKIKEANGYND